MQYRLLGCLATLLLLSSAAKADVVYLQNFGYAGAGSANLSTVGWTGYYGNAATNAAIASPGNSGLPANAQISGGTGNPTNVSNVNAGTSASNTNGFVPLQSADGVQSLLAITSQFTLDRSQYSIDSFQWYAASQYAGDQQRLAIDIDGTWYASAGVISPVFNVAGNQFSTSAQQATIPLDPSATNWRLLNFTPGQPLTLGATITAPLPSDNITSFGVFAQLADQPSVTNERTYIDTFTVNATPTPEPSASEFLFAAGPLLIRRRR